MGYFNQLLENRILISAVIAWLIAQVVKFFIYRITNKSFNKERLYGDGGMPSCHSATVCALAVSCLLCYGIGSPIFALATILAVIIMHDAMGVRLESGKHAQALNEIMHVLASREPEYTAQYKLKEFLGHTAFQVVIGGLLGAAIAIVIHFI